MLEHKIVAIAASIVVALAAAGQMAPAVRSVPAAADLPPVEFAEAARPVVVPIEPIVEDDGRPAPVRRKVPLPRHKPVQPPAPPPPAAVVVVPPAASPVPPAPPVPPVPPQDRIDELHEDVEQAMRAVLEVKQAVRERQRKEKVEGVP